MAGDAVVDNDLLVELLHTTFGGDLPTVLSGLIDTELCAGRMDEAKLGLVFGLGSDEAPAIRLHHEQEEARFADKVGGQWPAAKEFLAQHADQQILAETNGDSLRLFAIFEDAKGSHQGAAVLGEILDLPANARGPITLFDAPPANLSAAQAAGVKPLVDQGAEGQWMGAWHGDALVSFFWITEQPFRIESNRLVEALGGGARLTALRARLAAVGANIDPYMVEWPAQGDARVCVWGVRTPGTLDEDVPDMLRGGHVPDSESFAALVARAVPESDADAVRGLLMDGGYADRVAAAGEDVNAALKGFWKLMMDRMSEVPPEQRKGVVAGCCAALSLNALQREATDLALARYVADRPDVALDEDVPYTPSAEAMALSLADITARATDGLAKLEALDTWAQSVPELGVFYEEGLSVDAPTTRDLLSRAQNGDFAAATGVLHEVLEALGPGGYDDDASSASLDDIDLEAEREAAIEEALAMDDDEDF